MSVINIIAAGQQGLAFQNLARRFHTTEHQVAIAVSGLVPEIVASMVASLGNVAAAAAFLRHLSDDYNYSKYDDPSLQTDFGVRDLGISILTEITRFRDIPGHSLVRIGNDSGITTSDLERMLPFVTVLTLSAIRIRYEPPFRQLLGDVVANHNWAKRQPEPFGPLASHLVSNGQRPGVGLLASLRAHFDIRRTQNKDADVVAPTPVAPAPRPPGLQRSLARLSSENV